MDEKKLKALAAELAKGIKTEADLNAFSRMLTKLILSGQKLCFLQTGDKFQPGKYVFYRRPGINSPSLRFS